MNKKIVKKDQAIKIAQKLRGEGKSIVLTGGCFDILHVGHIRFLQKAKRKGDVLMIILESDETVRRLKGKERPINTQEERAEILAALDVVDYILLLPVLKSDRDYDELITKIHPKVLATTKGDSQRRHKERQAKLVNASIIDIIERIPYRSTGRLARILYKEGL